MRQKVIIDTDPGIDDAMAIFAAMGEPGIELLGLTTTFGNVSVDQATRNALTLLEMAGRTIPVVRGAERPLYRTAMPYPDFVHGADGFGNLNLPAPQGRAVGQDAAAFMVEQVLQHPGEVSLVAVGPLGNLARALALEPSIATRVRQVVIMGGTIVEGGNVTPVAEANIYADPEAADRVMAADWPLTLVGLDVTQQVLLSRALFADIAAHNPRVGPFLQQAAEFYIRFYETERDAVDGCFGHDISAVACVVRPELFGREQGSICVATEGVAAGQTIMKRKARTYVLDDWERRSPKQVCLQVDAPALIRWFRECLTGGCWQ
ncbi:MAG: nucleoside hydrolase [Thiothrix sp.]|nr:nucleoside hydrolase [Thiothrix sp.]